ncbi:MAG: hypothetical protein COA36_07620 [Desulfotalea sp.]|nr:MAG: hypothetical protein COA36_07620 [Desulfotalea sp.]
MSDLMRIESEQGLLSVCETVIVVPEIAIKEAGYIKVFTSKDAAHAKHEYHAMAQIAYFQYQDDELEIKEVTSTITIATKDGDITLEQGLVLSREPSGDFLVFIHPSQNRKKLLEAGYRYCTRWVRLDI